MNHFLEFRELGIHSAKLIPRLEFKRQLFSMKLSSQKLETVHTRNVTCLDIDRIDGR